MGHISSDDCPQHSSGVDLKVHTQTAFTVESTVTIGVLAVFLIRTNSKMVAPKLIVVLGATGQQGGSVVNTFVARNSHYSLPRRPRHLRRQRLPRNLLRSQECGSSEARTGAQCMGCGGGRRQDSSGMSSMRRRRWRVWSGLCSRVFRMRASGPRGSIHISIILIARLLRRSMAGGNIQAFGRRRVSSRRGYSSIS